MAENVTYSKIVELLDNTQYLAALKKAEDEEKLLTGLRVSGGQAAVKAFKATEAAAKQAAKETERAAKGPSTWTLALQANTKALGDQMAGINKAREATGALGAALGLVSPQLATVVGGIQKAEGAATAAAGAAQILGASLSTVALVAGPLVAVIGTVAYAHQQEEERAKEAAARTEDYTTAIQALTGAMKTLNEQQVDLGERAGLLTGEFTAQEQAFDKAHTAAMKATASQREVLDEQLSSLIARRDALRGSEQNRGLMETFFGQSAGDMAREGQQVTQRIKTIEDGLKALDEQSVAVADTTVVVTAAETRAAEATKTRKQAVKDLNAELKQENDEQEAFLAGIDAMIAGNEGLSLAATSLALAQQEANAAIDDTIAGVNDYGTAVENNTKTVERWTDYQKQAVSGVSEAFGVASDAIGSHLDDVLGQRYEKISDLEAAIEKADEKGQTARAKGLKQQLAAEKAAAQKAFDQQQTLSAANATVNWLEALVKATTYGPIGGPIVAAAATAAYGFSLKSIESEKPEFTDTPRPVRLGGDRGRDVGGARGAENDSAVFYRDPNQGIAQIVGEAVRRSMPAPPKMSQVAFGLSLGSIGVNRLLTSDLRRANRNQLS